MDDADEDVEEKRYFGTVTRDESRFVRINKSGATGSSLVPPVSSDFDAEGLEHCRAKTHGSGIQDQIVALTKYMGLRC